ncbi:MAG: DUF4416 family protein [Candidatus Omnitrophica bacterium]|nr:DUF4416 family protein [Candidatus Omnitrophota bacterium]
MGRVHIPARVKLIVGFISAEIELLKVAQAALEKAFGRTDYETGLIDFGWTDYYEEEMGLKLKRKFLGFKKLVDLDNIYRIKLKTNMLEKRYYKSGKRRINIDPGYIDLSKLVLFSTKDYSHRIYLNKGIFADPALFYRDRTFNPWPWTYPDYKSEAYINIFNSIRAIYKQDLSKA